MRLRLTPRTTLLLIACAGLLVVVIFLGVIRHQQETAPVTPSGSFLLTSLSFFNILVLAVLILVLFRELVKGFLSWRRMREGARFRTRLLISFVLLGLIPSLLLFSGAIWMIESTVESWFRSPASRLTAASQDLWNQTLDMVQSQSYRKARTIAGQLAKVPPEQRPSEIVALYKKGDVDALCLVDRDGTVRARMPDTFPVPDADKTGRSFGPSGLRGWVDETPVPTVTSGVAIDEGQAVLVGVRLPPELFARARFITDNSGQFLQIKSQRKALEIQMVSSFLALTLLVTFAAVWIGSLLSREISVPLQMLLEGTQALSRGDLQHTIPYEARDEIGIVVDSFNRMTQELAGSKSELERSNEDLRMTTESAERRRRYIETLLETLNIGVISTDPEGQIRTLNPKALEILGMSPGDAARDVLSRPEWLPVAAVLTSLPCRPVFNREVTLATKRGQCILAVTATPLKDPSGVIFGNLIILEDISNLSRAQRIAAWQEAAQRMAHEIKNPLTPIRLSAQRIRKKVREKAQDLESAVTDGCTTIEREVETMMTMVNEFSRFARLPETKLKPTSLAALLQGTAATYRTAYPRVQFNLDIPATFPAVRLDAEQMGRVFKNLFDNAIHAMEMSGAITVALREEDGQALVTVRDTGPGITAEARDRLFLPYYSTKRKGTGLGLAIVARILEEHGGAIRVDEEYRGGAGFVLSLPL